MRTEIQDSELIHSWLLDRLDKADLAFVRERGLDLRAMVRKRIESVAICFRRSAYVVLCLTAAACYFFGGDFMRRRGLITDSTGEATFVVAVLAAMAIGFGAIRFQAKHMFDNLERRTKSANDLSLRYILNFVSHDIRVPKKLKNK